MHLTKNQKYQLCFWAILILSFFTRFYKIHYPKIKYFDEVYHVPAILMISNNDHEIYEWWHKPVDQAGNYFDWLHPPVAKYIQAGSVRLFGNNPIGWRTPSAFFGVGVVLISFIFANYLFKNRYAALYVMALTSLDGLLLVQSRIAMNDIFFTLFALASVFAYWQFKRHFVLKDTINWKQYLKKSILISILLGLSVATKWTGLFLILALFSFDFVSVFFVLLRSTKKKKFFYSINILLQRLAVFIILPIIIYLASFFQLFVQGKDLNFIWRLHQEIIHYHITRDTNHAFASRPINWFLNNKPVWYWRELIAEKEVNIYAFGNPVLQWMGVVAVLASITGLSFFIILILKKFLTNKKRKLHNLNKITGKLVKQIYAITGSQVKDLVYLLWCYCWLWLPWVFSPRIMFYYHYTPAVPLLCMIIGWCFVYLQKKNKANSFFLVLMVATITAFIMSYKMWIGM